MNRSLALAGAVIMAGALVGCGGDGGGGGDEVSATERYCDELKTAEKEFGAISGDNADPKQLEAAINRMSEIADSAPEAVESEWEVIDGAITELRRGLREAGVTFEDLSKLSEDPTALPEGVDMAKLTKLAKSMQGMADAEFQDASKKIQKHAKDECNIELGS